MKAICRFWIWWARVDWWHVYLATAALVLLGYSFHATRIAVHQTDLRRSAQDETARLKFKVQHDQERKQFEKGLLNEKRNR